VNYRVSRAVTLKGPSRNPGIEREREEKNRERGRVQRYRVIVQKCVKIVSLGLLGIRIIISLATRRRKRAKSMID
jgi:hypothetical protein